MPNAPNITVFNPALKTYYAKKLTEILYKNNPFFALVDKVEDYGGSDGKQPIKYSAAQTVSTSFDQALTLGKLLADKYDAFNWNIAEKQGVWRIPRQAILASRGDKVAYLNLLTSTINSGLENMTKRIAVELYREGYGAIGQINSSITGATSITLARKADINNFEKDMYVDAASSLTATKRTRQSGISTTGLRVTAVNRNTGVVTFANAIDDGTNGLASVANGDYLFYAGDHESTTGAMTSVAGLAAWIPATDPTSAAFFGVDRTSDIVRLSGVRLDATNTSLDQALIDLDQMVVTQGGSPTHAFIHTSQMAALNKQREGKVQIINEAVPRSTISFKAIELQSMGGNTIKLIADRNCPSDRLHLVDLKSFKLYSMGPAVNPFNDAGNVVEKAYDADAVEYRAGFYGQLVCDAPGHNGTAILTPVQEG